LGVEGKKEKLFDKAMILTEKKDGHSVQVATFRGGWLGLMGDGAGKNDGL